MKFVKTFETFNLDSILDKISRTGIESLNKIEKDYLDAHSSGDKSRIEEIEKKQNLKFFKSNDGLFSFLLEREENTGDEIVYYGTIHVPSIEWENDEEIEGDIIGRIVLTSNHQIIPYFEKEYKGHTYDILEFCQGIEYELDSFLQTIMDEN